MDAEQRAAIVDVRARIAELRAELDRALEEQGVIFATLHRHGGASVKEIADVAGLTKPGVVKAMRPY